MGATDRPMELLVTRFAMHSNLAISNMRLLFLLAIVANPGQLWATPDDTVSPYIAESITYDDNLLRLSKEADPLLVSGQTSTAETIKQTIVGIKLDWKQDRQNVIVDASINESQFARFSLLDYSGKNLQARWNWQLGNDLSGALGYTTNTVLGSFAELQRLVGNLSTQQHTFFDGAWQARPSLRLNGAVSRDTNSLTSSPANGNELMNYEVGAYFTPPSGNELGIRAMRQIGIYPVKQLIFGIPVDNGYTQDQFLATVKWQYSGHILANGQAGIVSRTQNQLSSRDFSGRTMHGTLTWLASGKSQIAMSAWDEIDPYDDLTTSYTLSQGLSLSTNWNPTAKLGMAAQLQHLKRDFLGDPGLLLFPQPTRHDILNSASLSVNYQPVRAASISASIQTEHRGSNRALMDYADNSANLSVSLKF